MLLPCPALLSCGIAVGILYLQTRIMYCSGYGGRVSYAGPKLKGIVGLDKTTTTMRMVDLNVPVMTSRCTRKSAEQGDNVLRKIGTVAAVPQVVPWFAAKQAIMPDFVKARSLRLAVGLDRTTTTIMDINVATIHTERFLGVLLAFCRHDLLFLLLDELL